MEKSELEPQTRGERKRETEREPGRGAFYQRARFDRIGGASARSRFRADADRSCRWFTADSPRPDKEDRSSGFPGNPRRRNPQTASRTPEIPGLCLRKSFFFVLFSFFKPLLSFFSLFTRMLFLNVALIFLSTFGSVYFFYLFFFLTSLVTRAYVNGVFEDRPRGAIIRVK